MMNCTLLVPGALNDKSSGFKWISLCLIWDKVVKRNNQPIWAGHCPSVLLQLAVSRRHPAAAAVWTSWWQHRQHTIHCLGAPSSPLHKYMNIESLHSQVTLTEWYYENLVLHNAFVTVFVWQRASASFQRDAALTRCENCTNKPIISSGLQVSGLRN